MYIGPTWASALDKVHPEEKVKGICHHIRLMVIMYLEKNLTVFKVSNCYQVSAVISADMI